MQIHLIPVLLGDGIRLFEDLDPDPIERGCPGSRRS
jgi:hypothetical protein